MMNWPLVENNKIDQGAVAAFEAVQAQLKKQMEKYQPKYVVLMGAAACQYVLGLTQSFDELRGQLIANETLCAVITYGVNELLKVPSLKLSAWQDLQVIRKVSK
jgi:uracil-DNA glycosylase family 4